ncbi:hypothetical protein BpHYR1_017944 [Brachionus plicatilis]|uniref:Uncharacterized protein n=1 Tax=Brachionus plicatilis TaxID=10195 RepID=A0A3M7Q783_BRAPC|nr:hypothetical protein BpHYR1_017944 [Brachionus plicatilis]
MLKLVDIFRFNIIIGIKIFPISKQFIKKNNIKPKNNPKMCPVVFQSFSDILKKYFTIFSY